MLRLCAFVLLLSCAVAQSNEATFAGAIELPAGRRLDFVLRMRGASPNAEARLDIPAQGLRDRQLQDVEWVADRLRFTLGAPNPKEGWAHFDVSLDVADPRTAVGVMLQRGQEFRVGMRRVEEGVEARAGFEGELPQDPAARWSGTVDLGEQGRLPFHVRWMRAGDGYAAAGSIVIPSQGVAERLFDVEVGEREVRFVFRTGARESWATFELELAEGDLAAKGHMSQHGVEYPVAMKVRTAPRRPQLPRPPFPYTTREVRIDNVSAGVELAGTLSLPSGEGPHPIALLLTGSGTQDRDETIADHKPFFVIADHLTRAGIAVLRVDDRGAGGSTGDPRTATTVDYASDARACMAFLAEQTEIDPARIGLIGHSEGALIAIMVSGASESAPDAVRASWLVLLGSPGVVGREIVLYQAVDSIAGRDVPRADVDAVRGAMAHALDRLIAADTTHEQMQEAVAEFCRAGRQAGMVDASPDKVLAAMARPWYRCFVAYDPQPDLARIRVPVLALIGEKDTQVPPTMNLPPIRAALQKAGNPDVTAVALPGLNHLFQTAETGAMSEYEQIEETFSPTALQHITDWILERTKPR